MDNKPYKTKLNCIICYALSCTAVSVSVTILGKIFKQVSHCNLAALHNQVALMSQILTVISHLRIPLEGIEGMSRGRGGAERLPLCYVPPQLEYGPFETGYC